jgi:hypothetical protein
MHLRRPAPAITTHLLRAMTRTPVAALAVLATAPAVYAWARGHHDLSFPVTLASITGAASLGFAVDDPAEATLTACPTSRAVRRWVRAGLISIAIAACWTIVAFSAHAADYPLGSLRVRLAETVAAAAISVAFAARAGRDGSDSPGLAALTATLIVLAVSSGLALQITRLPLIGNPQHTTRWWTVAAAAGTAAWWWSRDPAARVSIAIDSLRRAVPTLPKQHNPEVSP